MANADGSTDAGQDGCPEGAGDRAGVPLADLLDRVIEGVALEAPSGRLVYANAIWRRLVLAPEEQPAATLARLRELPHFAVRSYPLGGDTLHLVRQDEAHLLREALDHLGSSLAVYDRAERYRFGNAAFHQRFGNHGDDGGLVGRTFEDLLRATLSAGVLADVQAVRDPEVYVERRLREFRDHRPGESERLSPAGQWDLLRTTYTPSGLRLSLRTDITEQKRVQEELRRAKERLEVETASRARFVGRLSHDLRTPLSAVLGYAELIESEALGPLGSPKYQEYAALVHQAGRQLLHLVEGLLEMSRTQTGAGEMREEPVDLGALLRGEIVDFEAAARAGGTQLSVVVPDGVPAVVADPRMVRQMVQALIANAVRHTPDGVVNLALALRGDGGVDVIVADSGSGMAPEVVARLGEPYFQARQGEDREAGPGLGIAIVRDLIEQHEGDLAIESAAGVGTTAILSFPAQRSAPVGGRP